jgi:hypothetical protein
MSAKRNQFNIPVFPHVRKFMLRTYFNRNGIFIIEEKNPLGKLVTLALLDRRHWKASNDQERDRVTAKVLIVLNAEQCKMGAHKAKKLQRLNLDIDQQFKEYMILWIKAQEDLGCGAHPACRSFLQAYGIDPDSKEEYSIDSAYKFWQREKGKIKKKSNSTHKLWNRLE